MCGEYYAAAIVCFCLLMHPFQGVTNRVLIYQPSNLIININSSVSTNWINLHRHPPLLPLLPLSSKERSFRCHQIYSLEGIRRPFSAHSFNWNAMGIYTYIESTSTSSSSPPCYCQMLSDGIPAYKHNGGSAAVFYTQCPSPTEDGCARIIPFDGSVACRALGGTLVCYDGSVDVKFSRQIIHFASKITGGRPPNGLLAGSLVSFSFNCKQI